MKQLRKSIKKAVSCILCAGMMSSIVISSPLQIAYAGEADETITLRICNSEEYIDEGGWDEEIDLENTTITSDNSMIKDFEEWYYNTYHKKVKVEYSCMGTNEELYNMLTLGDEYDIICPSEYMMMKLMSEGWLEPFSDSFYDTTIENNYYAKGVSPFIKNVFDNNLINGEKWSKYFAGYMWGITGIVYNPEEVTQEEVSTWKIINNDKFKRQITIKDNVRDTMFAAIAALKADKLNSEEFKNSKDYKELLALEMNDTSDETIDKVCDYLQQVKDNVYSFETDSGKADMVTGKVLAGYQWSGDAVYTMNQAELDGVELNFSIPQECTNLYFDGWSMLKSGINGSDEKRQVAESFINFVSMPENAVRNMYYIGYTSAISGGDDPTVYNYVKWNYESEEDNTDTETIEYPLGYFFSGNSEDKNYIITIDKKQLNRQLLAQYPSEEVMLRSAVMQYFNSEDNAKINQMWINVRCYNIRNIPTWAWILAIVIIVSAVAMYIKKFVKQRKEE